MKLDIKVCTSNTCEVIVKDITPVNEGGYLPESFTGVAKDRFRRSDTISIDLLVLNKTTGPEMLVPIFNDDSRQSESITMPVKFDGWFSVYHIIIPSKKWLDLELSKNIGSAVNLYDVVYFSDGSHLYKYIDGITYPATLEEIVDGNPEGTTISITYKNYVSICFLKKCYISLCLQIFDSRGFSKCWNKNNIKDDLVFRRDLVWMALNIIKYRVEFNLLAEALRIIEQIGGCNGLCKSEFKLAPNHGCGCSKG